MGHATRALALGKLVKDGIIYGGGANGTLQKLLDAAGKMQGAKNRAPLLLRCVCLFAYRGGGHTHLPHMGGTYIQYGTKYYVLHSQLHHIITKFKILEYLRGLPEWLYGLPRPGLTPQPKKHQKRSCIPTPARRSSVERQIT